MKKNCWKVFKLRVLFGVLIWMLLTESTISQNLPDQIFPDESRTYQLVKEEQGIDSALLWLLDLAIGVQRSSVDTCILTYEWALSEAEKHEKPKVVLDCLTALQFLYRISGQFEKGEWAARREINEFIEPTDTIARSIDSYLGLLYLDWGKYDSAQIYFKKYYLENKIAGNLRQTGIAANNVGLLYSKIGEFELAIKYYSEALELTEARNDTLATIYALHNLGGMFLRMQSYTEAEKYLLRAQDMCEQAGIESILYRSKILLAEVYANQGFYARAVEVCRQGLSYLEPLQIYPRVVEGYRVLAKSYLAQSQLDSTNKYLEKSRLILRHVDQVDLRLKVNQNLARLYQATNKIDEAIALMESTRKEAEEHQRDNFLADIYHWLASTYRERERWQESSEMALKANASQKAWELKRQSRQIHEMQTGLNLMYKNQEIAVLQAVQKEQSKQVKLQRELNIALVIILLGALLILGFTWKSLQKGKIITEQQENLHQQEIKMKDQERNLSVVKALVEGQETERKRIAAELHDGLGTLLAGIRLKLQSVLALKEADTITSAIETTGQQISEAYEEVRRISHDMMPGVLTRYGLVEALENLRSQAQELTSADVQFQIIGDQVKLSETCNIMIYRIFQELINNTVKHSDAANIFMQLSYEPESICLMVEDDGKGFDSNGAGARSSMGLKSLESRAKFLQGSLEVDSQQGKGTSVIVNFPFYQ